jgi:2-keto-4-pentenoate hydratase
MVNVPIALQLLPAVGAHGQLVGVLPCGHPDTDSRKPLFWLAEFLRKQVAGLRASQVVITDSLVGVIESPFGVFTTLQYTNHGEVGLTQMPL